MSRKHTVTHRPREGTLTYLVRGNVTTIEGTFRRGRFGDIEQRINTGSLTRPEWSWRIICRPYFVRDFVTRRDHA